MYRVAVRWEKCVYHQADLNKEVYIIQPKCNLFCFHTKEFLFRTSFKTSDMCSFICRSPSFERKITRKMLLQDIFFFRFYLFGFLFQSEVFHTTFSFQTQMIYIVVGTWQVYVCGFSSSGIGVQFWAVLFSLSKNCFFFFATADQLLNENVEAPICNRSFISFESSKKVIDISDIRTWQSKPCNWESNKFRPGTSLARNTHIYSEG